MLAEGLSHYECSMLLVAKKGSILAERARRSKLPCEELPFRFELDLSSARRLARITGSNGKTLVHAHTPHALGLAVLASKIGTVHPIVFSRRVSFPVKKFFMNRWKLNQADRILAVSHAVAAELETAGIDAQKIRVVHSAVDTNAFRYRGPSMLEPLNVMILGAMEKEKGIEEALSYVILCRDLPVLFHFTGNGPKLNAVREFASRRNNVEVHGFVQDVAGLLSKMFAAVSFSKKEGFPNLLLQAMAVGLPVIAWENEATKELISRDDLGCLFNSLDGAMEHMKNFLQKRDSAVQTGKCSSNWVRSQYSCDVMVRKTFEAYKEILD